MARILPVDGSRATTAPDLPSDCSELQAAFCALELIVSWTVAPLRGLLVIMSITLRTASEEELPLSTEFSVFSMPLAPYSAS